MAGQDALVAIQECIRTRSSFVVEAGAGSGKTRSLIETVQGILEQERAVFEQTNRRLVCITYTNVAKDEIRARLNDDPLVLVGTIHEFLWQIVGAFQRELKLEVLALNEASRKPTEDLAELLADAKISYGQYGRHFDRGELFHDDVISVAGALFEKYPKIARIAGDQFPYVFVDEYQDTSQTVVDLLLKFFVRNSRRPVVGFFGDSMQQIYDSNFSDVAAQHGLQLIAKPENFRCSVAVIEVLNRLRSDLVQEPAGDNKAGNVRLFVGTEAADGAYSQVIEHLAEEGWDLENTKVLMLTHRGIAREIGFSDLLAAYGKRSFGNDILMERQDEFGETFTFIEALIDSYGRSRFGEFLNLLGSGGFRIRNQEDKRLIATEVSRLANTRSAGTVGDVIEALAESKLIPLPRRMARFREKFEEDPNGDDEQTSKRRPFYDAVLAVPFTQVESFVDYADQHTPFSTKHGVKGAEFENVLVIVDDSLWNMYKFSGVFANTDNNSARVERSRKLLYVCFSRAISNLAVLCLSPLVGQELAGAKALLGVEEAIHLR